MTEEVRVGIVGCAKHDHVYLEDPNYLETVLIDGRQYIGKRAKNGIAVDRLEDMARSVVSLLSRVSTDWNKKPVDALIIAAQDGDDDSDEVVEGDDEPRDGFDYSELVD